MEQLAVIIKCFVRLLFANLSCKHIRFIRPPQDIWWWQAATYSTYAYTHCVLPHCILHRAKDDCKGAKSLSVYYVARTEDIMLASQYRKIRKVHRIDSLKHTQVNSKRDSKTILWPLWSAKWALLVRKYTVTHPLKYTIDSVVPYLATVFTVHYVTQTPYEGFIRSL